MPHEDDMMSHHWWHL